MEKIVSLKQNYEFKRMYKRGRSSVQPCFVLYVRKNSLSYNRLGITVSKKVGNAIVRNRIRRRLKEVYRLNLSALKRGYDIVVVGRARAQNAQFDFITKKFIESAKATGILL